MPGFLGQSSSTCLVHSSAVDRTQTQAEDTTGSTPGPEDLDTCTPRLRGALLFTTCCWHTPRMNGSLALHQSRGRMHGYALGLTNVQVKEQNYGRQGGIPVASP